MKEIWTKEMVKIAFINLLKDTGLITRREEKDLEKLAYSLQELADLFGGKVEALKAENKALRRQLTTEEARKQVEMFNLPKPCQAPKSFRVAHNERYGPTW